MTARTGSLSLAAELARFAVDIDPRQTSSGEAVLERARLHLLDTVGLTLAGWLTEDAVGDKLVTGLADAGSSVLIGTGRHVSAPTAALINGALATAWSFDDVDLSTVMHCESFAVSAALAVAADRPAPGRRLLDAIVVGIEVALRLASAVPGSTGLYDAGFHGSSVFGSIGAAAAAGRMLELDPEQMTNALALAVSFASGTAAGWTDGSGRNKTIQPGWAAHSGVIAARLAAAGYSCSHRTLDDDRGLMWAHTRGLGWDRSAVLAGAGVNWRLESLRIKRHPTGSSTQATVDCALRIVQDYGVQAADVVSARILLPTDYAGILHDIGSSLHRPPTGAASIGSFPLILARVLLDGSFTLSHRTDAAVRERTLLDLADRVTVAAELEAEAHDPDVLPTVIEVLTASGAIVRVASDSVPHEDDRDAVIRKFSGNVAAAGIAAEQEATVRDAILAVDEAHDVRSLLDALRALIADVQPARP